MKKFIKNSLSNPKVQLALCVLLSVILAIGFFSSPGANVYGEVGLGKGFLIASLNPMAAAFTLIPFVMSVIGIGISAYKWNKQNTDKNRQKANARVISIEREKKSVKENYETEYNKLVGLTKSGTSHTLSDPANQNDLAEIKKFINDKEKKIDATSTIDNPASPTQYTYEELLDLYVGAKEKAVELKKFKAEINAWEELEKTDLKTPIRKIEKSVKSKIQDEGIAIRVITKLASADKSKSQQ
jgi:hypothetical protein